MRVKVIVASLGLALLAGMSAARAETYQPGEFFLLDLQKAVLSPKLLGPSNRFEPYPVEARTDSKNEPVAVADRPHRAGKVAAMPRHKPRLAKRTPPPGHRIARRSNPLDAYAADTRVQTWPCRSGGICNWR